MVGGPAVERDVESAKAQPETTATNPLQQRRVSDAMELEASPRLSLRSRGRLVMIAWRRVRSRSAEATLDELFQVRSQRSTVLREVLAGCVNYLATAYIVGANAYYQTGAAAGKPTGQPPARLARATAVATGLSTMAMGAIANTPLVVAPGMGTNGYFASRVDDGAAMPWRAALGVSLAAAVVYLVLVALLAKRGTLTRLCKAVPVSLLVGVGFGLLSFLAYLGLLRDSGMGLVDCGPEGGGKPAIAGRERLTPELGVAAVVLVAVTVGDVVAPDRRHAVVLTATIFGCLAAACARAARGEAFVPRSDEAGALGFAAPSFTFARWTGAQWATALWTMLAYVTVPRARVATVDTDRHGVSS